ncbi:MAG TPA: hypothetical protein VFX02_07260 [Gammaproteobacteria bacterium]|nr:hypothetical protein [Gammaproteobacteria bacterium]
MQSHGFQSAQQLVRNSMASASAASNSGEAFAKHFGPRNVRRFLSKTGLARQSPPSEAVSESKFSIAAASDSYDFAHHSRDLCETGWIDHYLMLNGDGTGIYVVDQEMCLIDGFVFDGQTTYEIDIFDFFTGQIILGTMSFNLLTTTQGAMSSASSGSMEFYSDYEIDHTIFNVIYESGDRIIKLENMSFQAQYSSDMADGNFIETISGRVYDSNVGYVDVETAQTFQYEDHVPVGGELLLTGGNGKARLEVPGGTGFTFDLDADGDDVFENSATINLPWIASGENADIGDDDGDGMHNSWETYCGLDPAVADGDADFDGDSISNLDEYLLASRPNNSDSIPFFFTDLALTGEFSAEQLLPGETYILTLTVSNAGPDVAHQVLINSTLPVGAEVESVEQAGSPMEDCAIFSASVRCSFLEIAANEAMTIKIEFSLSDDAGDFDYQSIVYSSASYDPDWDNNFHE